MLDERERGWSIFNDYNLVEQLQALEEAIQVLGTEERDVERRRCDR